jgi:hypothetical protein
MNLALKTTIERRFFFSLREYQTEEELKLGCRSRWLPQALAQGWKFGAG